MPNAGVTQKVLTCRVSILLPATVSGPQRPITAADAVLAQALAVTHAASDVESHYPVRDAAPQKQALDLIEGTQKFRQSGPIGAGMLRQDTQAFITALDKVAADCTLTDPAPPPVSAAPAESSVGRLLQWLMSWYTVAFIKVGSEGVP